MGIKKSRRCLKYGLDARVEGNQGLKDKGCHLAAEEVQGQGMERDERDLVKTLLKAKVKAHPRALISCGQSPFLSQYPYR
jgi:hypothetical protein